LSPDHYFVEKGPSMGEYPHSLRKLWLIAILFCTFPLCAVAQTEGVSSRTQVTGTEVKELWATLQHRLDTDSMKVGDVVTARVTRFWAQQNCIVPRGAILQGKVVELSSRSAGSRSTDVTVTFNVKCYDGPTVPMVLIAALYATEEDKSQMDLTMAMPTGIGAGATGRQSTNLDTLPTPVESTRIGKAPKVKVGQVTGIRHLSLVVPAAGETKSVLRSKDKRMRLDEGTRLAFHLARRARP
jgi:hypothetical protein